MLIRVLLICAVSALTVFIPEASAVNPSNQANSAVSAWQLHDSPRHASSEMTQQLASVQAEQGLLGQVQTKQVVEINPQSLKQVKRGDSLTVPLPNGIHTFVVTKRQINQSGSQTITAHAIEAQSTDFVMITLGAKAFHITVQGGDKVYTGRGAQSYGVLVAETDYQQVLPQFDMDTRYPPQAKSSSAAEQPILAQKRARDQVVNEELFESPPWDDNMAEIDVLFYYTKSTNALYNNDVQSRIDHIISITNTILSSSYVNATVRGQAKEIDYAESTVGQALDDMYDRYDAFANLDNERYLAGADTVALLQPISASDGACGVAYVLDPRLSGFGDYALSANGIDCSDYTVAHEIGHNLGLTHSRKQGDIGHTFDYALGYGVDSLFHTVMAYQSAFIAPRGKTPETKYVFSSPDILCTETRPCGIAPGEPNSADAASALRAVVHAAAAAFDPDPDTTLAADAIAAMADPQLRQCFNDHANNTRSDYAGAWTSVLCYGYSIDNFSGLEAFTSLEMFAAEVTSDVDFSLFADFDNLGALDIRPTSAAAGTVKAVNLDALANKSKLWYLGLQAMNIENIGFLNNLTNLETLILTSNPIADFSPIFGLVALQSLNLDNTGFPADDINRLAALKQLADLSLRRNNYVDLTGITFPDGLVNLNLSSNEIDRAPNLAFSPYLGSLNLSFNPLTNIAELAQSSSLIEINLQYSDIEDISPLGQMPQLQSIYLNDTPVKDIGAFASITQLTDVFLSWTQVTDVAPLLLQALNSQPTGAYVNYHMRGLTLPCWQVAYGAQLANEVYGSLIINDGECFSDQDDHDYDGDGIGNMREINAGLSPLLADSNGDGMNDRLGSSTVLDVDGDGKADIFVRNTHTFFNYGLASADSSTLRLKFGQGSRDIPVYGDFDGDGITDIAMRRPSTHMWYVQNSSDPGESGDYIQRVKFGLAEEDIPVPADYDGDGITDFAVRRPSTMMWYIQTSSGTGGDKGDGIMRVQFGMHPDDIPVVGDYDGDGKADIAVRRPSTQMWYILNSSGEPGPDGDGIQRIRFGLAAEDIPVPADYDGDGKTDIAVRRPSTQMWYIQNSSGEPGPDGDGIQRVRFGLHPDDIPIVDDYDGDGKADIAVRRASTQMQYILNSSGEAGPDGDGIQRIQFGLQQHYVPLQAPIQIRMQMIEANHRK